MLMELHVILVQFYLYVRETTAVNKVCMKAMMCLISLCNPIFSA